MITRKPHISVALLWAFILLLSGCASPGTPSGGPRDEQPPQVVEEESSPNPMINFDLDEIRITFDEWVNLRDAATQIVISPPIEPRIMPRINKKTIVIPIEKENLREGTTYVINFGEAVQDITERNPAKDLLYVFSTGPYVDSLTLSGSVFDATTDEGVEGVKVILHDALSDTAITKMLPAYFTTTDETGNFTLRYLRSDTFRVFAILEGEFGNYRYDFGEQLGFIADPVIITDTLTASVQIPLYTPRVPIQVITNSAGIPQKVSLTREMIKPGIQGDTSDIVLWKSLKDTMYVWYAGSDTVEVGLIDNGEAFDTVNLFPQSTESAIVRVRLDGAANHPDFPIAFNSNHPLESVDAGLIEVIQGDTMPLNNVRAGIDTNDITRFTVSARWEAEGKFTVILLPGAVTNVFGNSNDTVSVEARFQNPENFGNLNLTVTGLDSAGQFLIDLLDKQTVVESRVVADLDTFNWVLPRMPVKPYTARIVEDNNRNGIWDTGDLAAKRQPERIFSVPVEGMRPGWDLDFAITWPEQ